MSYKSALWVIATVVTLTFGLVLIVALTVPFGPLGR